VKRALLVGSVAVLAAATVAAVLELGDDGREANLGESGVRTAVSLDPRQHLFGDTVRAQVDVVVDRDRIDPATVTLRSSFEPYEQVAPGAVERTEVGRAERLRWTFRLVCLEDTCMPDGPDSFLTFAPATVLADGRPIAEIEWPQLGVSSRIVQPTGSTERSWSLGAGDIPAPTFRISPDTAVLLLAIGAAALVGVGALFLVLALRRPRRAARSLPPLERALALLDAARRGDQLNEERKALDLLSVELTREGEGELARAVTELAWAREHPADEATDSVAERVGELIRAQNGKHA
jgi:hypothetical protein